MNIDQEIHDRLYILFGKRGSAFWLKTHNLMLEGQRPEVLMETEVGKSMVLDELKLMCGVRNGP